MEKEKQEIKKQTKKSPKEQSIFLSDDALEDFKKSINKYPVLADGENERLALLSQYGDKEALDKLVNHNLRLALNEASRYFLVAKHLKPMDLIQEACIGIVEAAQVFEPSKGAFSTCAVLYIRKNLKLALVNTDDEIRKPANLKSNEFSYNKLISYYIKNELPMPSDEEICKILKVSKDSLNYFKNADKLIPTSMNKKAKEDEEDTELGDFIKTEKDSYDDALKKIDNDVLAAILKSLLRPLEYFVLYNRFFYDQERTLESIGADIGVSRERIRQLEKKALEKITPYMDKSKSRYKKVYSKLFENERIDVFNLKPITPSQILIYLYIKDSLSVIEKCILYYQFFGKYKIEWYLNKLMISNKEYEKINKNLIFKLKSVEDNITDFENFKMELLAEHQSEIYKINLVDECIVDFEEIKQKYDDLSYEKIIHLFEKNNIQLSERDINYLKRYFYVPSNYTTSKDFVEKEVYLLSFGYKARSNELSPEVLHPTYLENINEFDDEQRLYLESIFFRTKNEEEFYEKYPDSSLLKQKTYLLRRLERMHYHIYEFSYKNFNKERYLYIKEKFPRELTSERIKELDMYYGVNGRVYTISEIAELCGEDYIKVHDRLKSSRGFCMSLYYNRTNHLTTDFKKYIPYVLDESVEFTDEARNILKQFILENKDYGKISLETNLSRSRISNILTDAIRKMDLYRFGIMKIENIDINDLENFFKNKNKLFSDVEKKIIYLRKIEKIKLDEVCKQFNLKKENINKIIEKFNKAYRKYQSDNVILTTEDILDEINTHISESVISEHWKEVLSYYYGLKTKFNIEGIRLSLNDILEKFEITENAFWYLYKIAHEYIKSKKNGIYKTDLLYISRNELNKLLDDSHMPISNKEREIICYLFELKGYPYKTLRELKDIYNDNESSLRRRYQRAILNIYKYLNQEIEPQINYEIDIEPNLKYFSRSDELLILEYYKNGLSCKEISQKYKIKHDRVIENIRRINDYIMDLVSGEEISKFDFEFYREHKDDPKLQYYGDRELTSQIFEMYFGENDIKRLSPLEISKKLKIDNSLTSLNLAIHNFMLAFCKLQDGIEKVKVISNDEIIEYYQENSNRMNKSQLSNYQRYFSNLEKTKINKNFSNVSGSITYDILKFRYPDYFNLDTAIYSKVLSILKRFYYVIDESVRDYLMTKFKIQEREFMSNREVWEVYKILNRLEMKKLNKTDEVVLNRKLKN